MEELFLILLALLAIGWLLVGPILSIVLWVRVSRLNHEVQRLTRLTAEAVRASVARVEAPKVAEPQIAPQAPTWAQQPTAQPTSMPAPALAHETPQLVDVIEAETVPEARPATTGAPSEQLAATIATPAAAPVPSQPPAPGFSLEELLAGKWLTWVGALAVVIGVGFFFKYTIDQGLLGPTGRVVVGILAGMITFAGGAFAMLRNYRFFAQGLVGAALGILYFSLFAAFAWYEILPQNVAFIGMALVTAAALSFSAFFNAQPTAILGLLGGFLTPLMLSTGQDAQWSLFSYIFLLDLGVLGLATFRKWQPLQILALVLTAGIWLGWFEQHYEPQKLESTLILMTAFFLLFALLGIWYNVIRRQPAQPGDFILVLATPVIYFIGLYAVTEAKYAFLHGLLAVGMAGTYLALGLFALTRNPAGRKLVAGLCGVAASFLTVAIPLQLTGHWIAIAWAVESLLLVELGLRFGERKLRWAGLGLLVVVQFILLMYAGETLDDPLGFDTQFPQIDPVTMDIMSDTHTSVANPVPAVTEQEPPLWMALLNGRLLSFLASALVMGVMAWEYRRRPEILADRQAALGDVNAAAILAVLLTGVPVTLFIMLGLESFVFYRRHDWLPETLLGLLALWASVIALAVVVVAAWRGPRWYVVVGIAGYAVLAVLLGCNFLATINAWSYEWPRLQELGEATYYWQCPILNPRGLSFLIAIVAGIAGAVACQRAAKSGDAGKFDLLSAIGVSPAEILGLFAHLTGLAMLTIEVYAQGTIRDWGTGTALGITFVWTLYAIATLIAGIYFRTALVRILALALFLLTTAKVFFYDVWHLHTTIRTLAFIGLGMSLLLVSFLYRRYRDRIRAWIQPLAIALLVPTALLATTSGAHAAPTTRAQELMESLARRWPVKFTQPPPAGELTYVELPLDVYGTARVDLADVRLLALDAHGQAVEIPYVLESPTDSTKVVERSAPLLNLSELKGNTQFLLDLGDAAESINQLEIVVDKEQHNYERAVKVFGADRRDAEEWNLLSKDSYVLDVTRPGNHFRASHVDFPQSKFHFYKVVIENAGQPPLKVETAKVFDRQKFEAPRQAVSGKIVSQVDDADTKESRTVFDLQYAHLPTSSVQVLLNAAGNFYRLTTLEKAEEFNNRTSWQQVTSGPIFRIDRVGLQASETELHYSPTPGRYLRLTVTNGDDQPLNITGCTAKVIARLLVFRTDQLIDRTDVALYAGNAKLSAPSYDLARTVGNVERATLPELTFMPVEANPKYAGPLVPDAPWSERNQRLLWGLTIVGVLVFGGLTALLLRKAAALPPSE